MKNRDDDPFGYEYDLMKTLEQIIYECDRKAERSKQRLQAQEQQNGTTTLLPVRKNSCFKINFSIQTQKKG